MCFKEKLLRVDLPVYLPTTSIPTYLPTISLYSQKNKGNTTETPPTSEGIKYVLDTTTQK